MPLQGLLQPVLLPISWLYSAAARVDAARRIRSAHHSSLPVISVGNISIGGSGKTPLVRLLIERLQRDRDVLVLSRGYGRQGSAERVWRSGEPLPDPALIGDEPALLARFIERGGIAVGVDRGRLLGSIESEFSGAVAILDDGFQHRQLARDVDIVIVDSITARGPHRSLPAGRLREAPSSLRRADLIVATSLAARSFAQRFVPADRIHDAGIASQGVRSLGSDEALPYGSEVVLVTGIARPARVVETLHELGIEVIHHVRYPDHHRYTSASMKRIERAMHEHAGIPLVTTLKDAVKLERIETMRPFLHVVDVTLRMNDDERFLYAIRGRLERSRT